MSTISTSMSAKSSQATDNKFLRSKALTESCYYQQFKQQLNLSVQNKQSNTAYHTYKEINKKNNE